MVTSTVYAAIIKEIEGDPGLCHTVAHSWTGEGWTELEVALRRAMEHHGASTTAIRNPYLIRSFFNFCRSNKSSVGKKLSNAMSQHTASQTKHKRTQRKLVDTIGLNWDSPKQKLARDKKLATIPKLTMTRLGEPYPPLDFWVCDTPDIHNLWEWYLAEGPQSDSRPPRKPIMKLDQTKITTVFHNQSVRIVDQDGKLVGLVICDFCSDLSVLGWVNELIEKAVGLKKSCWPNHPGSLVMQGFSPGSKSRLLFGWVRNVTKNISPGDLLDFDHQLSSAFAFFWNLARSWVPPEIIEDYDNCMKAKGLPPMNRDLQVSTDDTDDRMYEIEPAGPDGRYIAVLNGTSYTFTNARLAPSQGYIGGNYAAPMHNEHPPHEWAISWTTGRDPVGLHTGGHFHFAQYGIQVEQCANTLIAWKPLDVHGTSLQHYDPEADTIDFLQTGMSFATSSQTVSEWHKLDERMAKLVLSESKRKDGKALSKSKRKDGEALSKSRRKDGEAPSKARRKDGETSSQ